MFSIIKNSLIIAITILLFVLVTNGQDCLTNHNFKEFVSIQSESGRYLKWNSYEKTLTTVPFEEMDHFFLEMNDNSSQLTISSSEYSFSSQLNFVFLNHSLKFEDFVYLFTQENNNSNRIYMFENTTSFIVSNETKVETTWKINFESKNCDNSANNQNSFYFPLSEDTSCSHIQFAHKPITVTSVTTNSILDVSGTTPYDDPFERYPGFVYNKVLFSNNETVDQPSTNNTFYLVPLSQGKFTIQDYYGNYLNCFQQNYNTFMDGDLSYRSHMLTLEPTDELNRFFIKCEFGYLSDISIYNNGLHYTNDNYSLFEFKLLDENCPTQTPIPTNTPSLTPSPTPSPTQTPSSPTTCVNIDNILLINSTKPIECRGNGKTFCRDSFGSTCSNTKPDSDVVCTTLGTSMKCAGQDMICSSGLVKCSYDESLNQFNIHDSSSN